MVGHRLWYKSKIKTVIEGSVKEEKIKRRAIFRVYNASKAKCPL